MSGVVFSVYFTHMWHTGALLFFCSEWGKCADGKHIFFFVDFAQLDTWSKNVVGAVSVRDEEYHYDLDRGC